MNILSARYGLFTSLFHRREPRPPSGWQSTRDMQDSGGLAPVEVKQQTTGEIRLDFARIREWNLIRRKGRVREAYEQYLVRPVQEPVYTLPAPAPRGTTGAFRPVRLVPDTGALPSMERPAWVEQLLSHSVQETPHWLVDEPVQPENWMQGAINDVTDEDCAPVDDCEPTELRKSVRDQRAIEQLIAATKESEK